MEYRREIDGLRALAVVPVILFHAGFTLFKGGFVGVDIFFVISGCLITSILMAELDKGRFSITTFYERRARRILPALFLVMLVCLPFAWAWMLPEQLKDFANSLIAVVLFGSNIQLWQEQGYFAQAAELKPLLHTWSLAVEEQYYLLFPLVLAALWRFGRRVALGAIMVAALASLAASEWGWRHAPEANFYLAHFRAWELLAGSICAFALYGKPRQSSNLLSLIGLALIVFSILHFDESTPFPGLNALAPVVGTALILIFAGPGSWAARLLGSRPLVGIGLISYSAYLWHQPLFAFARLRSVSAPSPVLMLGLAILSMILAYASWRWVERPFRRSGAGIMPRRMTVFLASALVGGLFITLGASVLANMPAVERLWLASKPITTQQTYRLITAEDRRLSNFGADKDGWQDLGQCRFNIERLTKPLEARIRACRARHGAGVAILGDSHAVDLFGVVASRFDTPFLIGITQASCRPHSPREQCQYEEVLRFLRADRDVFYHVIFEQAGFYLLRSPGGEKGSRAMIAGVPMEGEVSGIGFDEDHLRATRDYLKKVAAVVPVTWFGPRVEILFPVQEVLRRGCAFPFRLRTGQAALYERLDARIRTMTAGQPGLTYVSQNKMLGYTLPHDFMTCDAVYWSDGDHLSKAGEIRFGQRLPDDFLALARSKPR